MASNNSIRIGDMIESRMNETILEINKTYSIFEADKLHSELRILDWIFYQLCKDQQKNWPKLIKSNDIFKAKNVTKIPIG